MQLAAGACPRSAGHLPKEVAPFSVQLPSPCCSLLLAAPSPCSSSPLGAGSSGIAPEPPLPQARHAADIKPRSPPPCLSSLRGQTPVCDALMLSCITAGLSSRWGELLPGPIPLGEVPQPWRGGMWAPTRAQPEPGEQQSCWLPAGSPGTSPRRLSRCPQHLPGASLHPWVPPPPRCLQQLTQLCPGSPAPGPPSERQRCPVTPPLPGGALGPRWKPGQLSPKGEPGRAAGQSVCTHFLRRRLKAKRKVNRAGSFHLSLRAGLFSSHPGGCAAKCGAGWPGVLMQNPRGVQEHIRHR